ncbi:MAG: hypothetical protein CFE21_05290 [Bacteroidetes bacterium B1(2017)]|nr:MAG: hypothetical protein CFE21_05290 [Bacteroidetes bacterium B1(2017)]
MKTAQLKFTPETDWQTIENSNINFTPTLALIFGSTKLIKENTGVRKLKEKYPQTLFIGGTSAGEICGTSVVDDTIIATLIEFEKTTIKHVTKPVSNVEESFIVGEKIVEDLIASDLKHVFVMSEGLHINGSELVRGLRSKLPAGVSATGGLAGDGANFSETYILDENGLALSKSVSAIGFYGSNLSVSFGSMGGWDSFGVERLVTKSTNNVLYELDGKPALDLYKSFLGEHASNLPASGLLFPLNLRTEKDSEPVVRTILAVDEEKQSLTFAGDIPEGSYVRLMKANFDRLIEGAMGAAKGTLKSIKDEDPSLAILISCVGRKLVLKQIIEEEVEGVQEILGTVPTLCGFYSYGEISPFSNDAKCELHNQTMTITTFKEIN